MGYGILRGQKCKLGDIKGMEIHILRVRKSRSNPDIDTDKTSNNYAIIEIGEGELNNRVARRIEELLGQRTKTGKIRKIQDNAVRMYDFIATGTHEDIMAMAEDERKKYFNDIVDFFKCKFGEKNIMYAVVHNDERTPHLHLGLVPEYKGKLAAYQLFTPQSMRDLQDEFYEQISSRYGLERGELVANESEDKPKRKHKTAVELRSETLAEVNREKVNLTRLRSDVADVESQREKVLQELDDLQVEKANYLLRKQKEAEELVNRANNMLQKIYNEVDMLQKRAKQARARAKKRKEIETIRKGRILQFKREYAKIKAEAENEKEEIIKSAKVEAENILKPLKEEIIPALQGVDTAIRQDKGVKNAVIRLWQIAKKTFPFLFEQQERRKIVLR